MPTYTFQTPEGQTRTIAAPRPLRQDELLSVARQVRRGGTETSHVLRAPSAWDPLKSLAWEIPPLAGMIGGGLLGAPLGPLGSAGGAGLGYAGGRQFNRVVGSVLDALRQQPPPRISPFEQSVQILDDLGAGAVMDLLPGALGRMMHGAPPSDTLRSVREAAQRLGIELTPAAARGSIGLAQAQALPLRVPLGRGAAERGLARARTSAHEAATRLGEQLGGGADLERTGLDIQQRVNAIARAQEDAPTEMVDRLLDDVIGTSRQGKLALGGSVQTALGPEERVARQSASALYREALAGNERVPVPQPHTQTTSQQIEDLERRLSGLQTPAAKVARGLQRSSTGESKEALGTIQAQLGGPLPSTMAQDLIDRYGLQTIGTRTLEETLAIQQRLRAAVRTAKDDVGRHQLRMLLNAVTKDLSTFGRSQPTDLGRKLAQASQFYRREVAEDFARQGLLRRMLSDRPGQVADRILNTKSPDVIQALLRRLPERQGDEVRRGVLEKLRDRSMNVTTGQLDPVKFESNLRAFGDENLGLLMGKHLRALAHLRETLTRGFIDPDASHPVFARMLSGRAEGLVNSLTKGRVKSLEDLHAVYRVLEPATQRDIARSLFQEVLEHSIDIPTGQFSMQRFVSAKEAVPQAVWDTIVQGNPASALRDIERVYRHIITVDRPASNPSGTGQAMLAAFQILELITGAGEIARGATGALGGTPEDLQRGVGAIGLGLGVPYGLGQVLFSPLARRRLVPPLTASPPGTVTPSTLLFRLLGAQVNESINPSVTASAP